MRKLILFTLLFLPAICFGGTTDYFNLSHYAYVPSTPTATGEYYYRGGFHVGRDTQTLAAPDINTQFDVWESSIIFKVDGINIDFSIDKDSFTFYNPISLYSLTEAELKTTTPTVVGQLYDDTTNGAVIRATGTVNAGSFSIIYDKNTVPTGW